MRSVRPRDSGLDKRALVSFYGKMKETCLFCEKRLPPGNHRRKFCSEKCRLLYWAAGEILKAYRAGKADGLRGIIKELSRGA